MTVPSTDTPASHTVRAACLLACIALAACSTAAPGATAPAPAAPQSTATAAPVASATAAQVSTLVPVSTAPAKRVDDGGPDFTPKVQSVWDTQVGPDTMKGCTGGSLLPAYGLVQITPESDTLTWKNQEPKPYPMKRVKAGVWAYEGPSALNDGIVKMVATFTGEKTLKMSRSFTPKNEPGCVHTHEYTGEFKWERP